MTPGEGGPRRRTPSRRATLARAVRELGAADPVLASLARRHGHPSLEGPRTPVDGDPGGAHFAELARSVLHQQVAGRAAAAIHARLEAAAGTPLTPGGVLALGTEGLRGVGLSGTKAATLAGLADAVTSGALDLGAVGELGDEQVVATLSDLRGIGPWTAQMFCIFQLGRLDVWPVTDYGVRKGYARAWQLPELPAPRALEAAGDRFRPWRSVAAWYCWRAAGDPTAGG